MVRLMLEEACQFLEEVPDWRVHYFRCYFCWKGPDPVAFQPSSADKMVLRKIMEERVKQIPEELRLRKYAATFGLRALFYDYLPFFDGPNRSHPPE